MQRKAAAAVGFVFVAALVGLIVASRSPKKTAPKPTLASASARASAAPEVSAAPTPSQTPAEDAGIAFSDDFINFPDGGKVPELPDSAPKAVSFGVVLFTYQGAQFAPSDARTREQARQKASALIELARKDFSAAVAKGDHGSTADAGRIPRGVLEPPIEYLLFTLDKGAVHPEPVDTPRGYWILRRND